MDNELPENPDGDYPYGSLPGDKPQLTPEERAQIDKKNQGSSDRLNGFIDFDEVDKLSRSEKVQLVQNICERFVQSHLNGMNGSVGYSDTLRPEVTNKNIVVSYRKVAKNLYGQGAKHLLPYRMDDEDVQFLKHVAKTDNNGKTKYFESIIKPPKLEPNPKNPYLQKESYVYHDARLLDTLIQELYIDPNPTTVGFSVN